MSGDEPWSNAGRWFDEKWYLLRNPDVARVGIDPLTHYLRYGEAEGRQPSPWFDPAWYHTAYTPSPGQSALEHFLVRRCTGQFLPCAALYPVPLLSPWRDDIVAGRDPFDHYLRDMQVPERELMPELAIIQSSGLIDPAYHRLNTPVPFEAELDPVLHYCRFGWRWGRKPSTAFDPGWYGETNPIVARLRINPLTHYILEGEHADRWPVPWFDPAWYRTRYDVPAGTLALAHYLKHRHDGAVSPNKLFDPAWYAAHHGAADGEAFPAAPDPFSHYLVFGAVEDINPSPDFDARAWRHRHMAPLAATSCRQLSVAARNPLVRYLTRAYLAR